MGRLISLGLMLIFGLVAYNYFFGDESDRESVSKITSGVKELIKSTKVKYEAGDYDDAIKKIGDAFNEIKDKIGTLDSDDLNDLEQIEKRKEELERELEELEQKERFRSLTPVDKTKSKEKINEDFNKLVQELDDLMNKIEKKQQ